MNYDPPLALFVGRSMFMMTLVLVDSLIVSVIEFINPNGELSRGTDQRRWVPNENAARSGPDQGSAKYQ